MKILWKVVSKDVAFYCDNCPAIPIPFRTKKALKRKLYLICDFFNINKDFGLYDMRSDHDEKKKQIIFIN